MVAGGVPERKVISMERSNFGVEWSLGAVNSCDDYRRTSRLSSLPPRVAFFAGEFVNNRRMV
jgi:hypothetical protein